MKSKAVQNVLCLLIFVCSLTVLGDGTNWGIVNTTAPWGHRTAHQCTIFQNKMWIIGGRKSDSGSVKNDVWSSSDGTNWSLVTASAPWSARMGHECFVFNNKLWLLGGNNPSGYLNDIWFTDNGTNWSQVTDSAIWPVRSTFGSAVFNDTIWIMGGYGCTSKDVWKSSDGTNWIEVTSDAPWGIRTWVNTLVHDNKLWMMGGEYYSSRNNSVWSSEDGTNWTEVTEHAGWSPRGAYGSTIYQDKMWVLAGNAASTVMDVWSSENGTNWTLVNENAPWGSRSAFECVTFRNKMWVVGGGSSDVWKSPARDFSATGMVTIVSGAIGDGTLSSPYDLESTEQGVSDTATFRLSIEGSNVTEILVDRISGNTNFSAFGLASSIAGGNAADFTVTYTGSGVIDVPETASFMISGEDMASIIFVVKSLTVWQTPKNIIASDGTFTNKIFVTWSACSNATKYVVYRNTADNISGAADVSGEITNTYFDDVTAFFGHTYFYWIKAGYDTGWSDLSVSDSGYKQLSVPTDISASDGDNYNKVVVTWNLSVGATKYTVYRSSAEDTNIFSLISGEIANTSFEDTNVVDGTVYYYRIKAGCDNGWSDFSDTDSGYAELSIPTDISASDGIYTNKVEITWTPSLGATKYKVYRNTIDNNNSASDISGEITGTSFEDTNAVNGTVYYYLIKAGCDNGWSDYSDSDSGYAKLSVPLDISATDGIFTNRVVITWSVIPDAAGYNVYRGNSTDLSNSTLLCTLESNSYSDTSVTPTAKYYYWIQGTASACNSDFSDYNSGYAMLFSDNTTQGTWKYKSKNNKAKLKVKNLGLNIPLANYLEDGCLVGLKDASNNKTVDGPRKLEPLKKKNGEVKKWQYIEKKAAIIKYIPKNDKLIYKVWQNLPANVIFFIQPPEDETEIESVYLNIGTFQDSGWQSLPPANK